MRKSRLVKKECYYCGETFETSINSHDEHEDDSICDECFEKEKRDKVNVNKKIGSGLTASCD